LLLARASSKAAAALQQEPAAVARKQFPPFVQGLPHLGVQGVGLLGRAAVGRHQEGQPRHLHQEQRQSASSTVRLLELVRLLQLQQQQAASNDLGAEAVDFARCGALGGFELLLRLLELPREVLGRLHRRVARGHDLGEV
jgi:hypothetical protein